MPAEVEEIVVQSDTINPQDVAPNSSYTALHRIHKTFQLI